MTQEIQSKVLLTEAVHNKDRKFGEATEYFPVVIEVGEGVTTQALFTRGQIDAAIDRAKNNVEDCDFNVKRSWLSNIFGS